MIREFPLWVLVLLPSVVALLVLVLAQPLARLLGARRAFALAHYSGLGATVMALLFVAQAVQHLNIPEDPRALGQTLLPAWPLELGGELKLELTLIGDRLSIATALVIAIGFVLARLFVGGPAGMRELGLPELAIGEGQGEPSVDRCARSLRRLGLLGLLEAAAMLVVLASHLALIAVGWAVIGIGAALAVARELDDERRASAATRVLALGFIGDLALMLAALLAHLGGLGIGHDELWSPLAGERLFATDTLGVPLADALALMLVVAVAVRLGSLVQLGSSIAEALLEAVIVAVPALYLLLRYQRVLACSPTLMATLALLGVVAGALGVAVALVRPGRGQARRRERPGDEQALAGTAMAWFGAIALALSVGAWRTAVLLLLAHVLGRLGLRLALLTASSGSPRLPTVTGHVTRVLAFGVAGIAPALGFVALGRLAVDVLARNNLLAPWFSWIAAVLVLVLALGHAAAIGRLWYHRDEANERTSGPELPEDGLDFFSSALAALALLGLGLLALAELYGFAAGPTAWIAKLLPEVGGHPSVPLQIREGFRGPDGSLAFGWTTGALVLTALLTGFGWLWSREHFRRGDGHELSTAAGMLERALAIPRRSFGGIGLGFVGLAELAARGLGRGLFEEGPRVIASLSRDLGAGLEPRLRRRGLILSGARQAVLGLLLGVVFVLGWLFFKPSVVAPLPEPPHGFGGLRPRLIRAGGLERDAARGDAEQASEPGTSEPLLTEPPAAPPPRTDPRLDPAIVGPASGPRDPGLDRTEKPR